MYISGWPDGLADRQESGVNPTVSWKSVASYENEQMQHALVEEKCTEDEISQLKPKDINNR